MQHSSEDQPGITLWPVGADLRIVLPHRSSEAEPSLGLLLSVPQAPFSLRQQLIPELVGDEVKTWLAQALQQGNIRDAAFALQTVPSSAHPQNSTSAQLYLEFEQATVRYLEEWPEAAQLSGRLLLDAPKLDVWLDQGRTLGGHLVANSGRIRLRPQDGGGTLLDISTRLSGDSNEALQYFIQTPLQAVVNHAFDDWQASGPVTASMSLQMPLGTDGAVPLVSLTAEFEDNTLRPAGLDLSLTGVTGALQYRTDDGLSATSLRGSTLGGRFQASIRTETSARDGQTILLSGQGDAGWQAFREWMPLFLLEPVSGRLNYDAGLSIASDGVIFRFRSDLQGTSVNLPYPMGKTASEERTLEAELRPGDGLTMQFRYGELMDARLLLQDSQLQRGQVMLGGQVAQLPEEPGVEVRGQLATELIAEDWWDAWQRISQYQTDMAATAAQSASALQENTDSDNPLQRIDLTLGEVLAWEMPMGVTHVLGQQTSEHWAFNVDSTLLRGVIQLPHDESPLQARLDYLHFPEPEPEPVTEPVLSAGQPAAEPIVAESPASVPDSLQDVNPADFPAVDMSIGEVFVGGRHLGSWTFTSRPQAQGLSVQVSDSDLHGLRTTGQLDWLLENDQHQTRLSGLQFSSKNVGRIQRGLRQPPVIEGKDLEGSADLQWQGSPLAFNVASLNGAASLRIRDGLVAAEGAGALRAFGALNFNSMARRLKLDFSDLYKSGVSFDVLRGKASVEQGLLTLTEPLLVDGPGGRFLTSGSTDLNRETLDMKLAVTFPVTSSLPMVAVLAGLAPPVAASIYVTEKLIGDELSRFTSASYDLRGTWREPDMQINRAFDNKVDGSRSRSLKQRILSIFGLDDD